MDDKNVTVDPRYLSYNKAEVEALLEKVENIEEASEEGVRDIVRDWEPASDDQEPGE